MNKRVDTPTSNLTPPLKPGPMPENPQPKVSSEEGGQEVDRRFMDLYSRQIGTYGMDTMVRLISLKVLLVGCRGTGAEAAKNLALAGVHTIGMCDATVCAPRDQGTNFCITDEHVAKKVTRAEATHSLVAQLNPNTRCRVVTDLSEASIHEFDVVIVTTGHSNFSKSELARINAACRSRAPMASFLACYSGGANGSLFVDHGPGFVTKDPDGRAALQKSITEVVDKVDKKGRAYTRIRMAVPEGMTPGSLRDATEVTFSDVAGLVQTATGKSINDEKVPFPAVQAIGDPAQTIRIYPSLAERGYGAYGSGGFVHEVKEVTVRDFRPLEECLAKPPALLITDSMYTGIPEKNVHLAVASALAFGDKHNGALPTPADSDVAEVLAIAKAIQAEGEKAVAAIPPPAEVAETPADPNDEMPSPVPPPPPPQPFTVDFFDEDFVKKAAATASVELQPLATLLGAIVAQEVVKVTGKFTPVHQFLHLNFAAVLPDTPAGSTAPVGDRYDDLRSLFGADFVAKLQNLKMFMVGCGALGCEYIKNFALNGICCGPNGQLTVTDNDRIEVSNLNRQFLFREENVGQQKSVAAGNRAKIMNRDLKIDARQDFVSESTEHSFPDTFWESLDVVTNALDNMAARLYVDDKCILFEKILVEAGTMGTGGNVDIVVPHKTTSYAEGGSADETGGIPMCTLRNFPYIFDHCIEWARAQFEDLFVSPIMMTQLLREDPQAFRKKTHDEVFNQESAGLKRSMLAKNTKSLQALLKVGTVLTASSVTIDDCVALAWNAFHAQFRDRIASLIKALPADATKKNGEAFWSGHRKFPQALEADLSDEGVREFLIATANLFACMLGVHGEKHQPVKNDQNLRWKAEYRTDAWLQQATKPLAVPPVKFEAVDDLDEETSSSAAQAEVSDEEQERVFIELLDQVTALGSKLPSTAVPLDFEKDDDDNFHIDFVAAAANLRARNYRIATKDRLAVKMVAGKIIPAIATTTAAVTGIALMELFKVLQGKEVSELRNGMIDLGANIYTMFDRDPPKKNKSHVKKTYDPESDYTMEEPIVAFPNPHTNYDKLIVDVTPASTVSDFVEALQAMTESAEEGPYEVVSLGVGKGMLWNGMPSHKNFKLPLLAVIAEQLEQSPATFWAHRSLYHRLAVNMESADGNEVMPATVVLRIRA